jgi:hypothetical protein
VLLILFTPLFAFANAGTSLMWGTMLHLVFGNVFIGLIEGLLLSVFFHIKKWKAVLILILANYASAWAGMFLVHGITSKWDITIENLAFYFYLTVALSFLLTLVIEFPFFYLGLDKTNRLTRSLKACIAINIASYLVLFLYYGFCVGQGASIMTDLKVVKQSQIAAPKGEALFYITPDNKNVIQKTLGKDDEKIISKIDISSAAVWRLKAQQDKGAYDLYLSAPNEYRVVNSETEATSELIPLLKAIGRSALVENKQGYIEDPRLASAANNDWICDRSNHWNWAAQGINGHDKNSKLIFHYAIEVPFIAWSVSNTVQFGNGLIVFQLGKDQICLLDPINKKIALVARGRSPFVVEQ